MLLNMHYFRDYYALQYKSLKNMPSQLSKGILEMAYFMYGVGWEVCTLPWLYFWFKSYNFLGARLISD